MSLARSYTGFIMLTVVLTVFTIVITSATGLALDPLQQYDTTLHQMLEAIRSKSRDQFVEHGDARFQNGFTEKMFGELAQLLGPRMRQGYEVTFLTTLRQQDYTVYIWKLAFKDNKDDYLIRMAVKDGLVRGFIIR
jgi:hypothetical protein